ncbi:hypothetical protein AB0E01_35265 [Nocardia vinacea]|uniref:hypothetical protein n=1 Tax=Nocardia vinacea TaxID=96468 RepID=UPI0033FC99F0
MTHNVTAASRLFDALPLLATDTRIRIVFTRTGSSAFDNGTAEFLNSRGVEQISWRKAVTTTFDLAISASYGGDLHRIDAPLIVVPHGMGYNKFLTKNKEQRTKNKEQRTKNKEQRTKNKESGIRSFTGMADSQGRDSSVRHRPLPLRTARTTLASVP